MRAIPCIIACLVVTGVDAKEPRRNIDALKSMDAFGRCVGQHQVDGMKLLATVPTSHEEYKQALKISTSTCLPGGELRFQASLLRGAVAEILLRNGQKALHRAKVVQAFQAPPTDTLASAPEGQRAAVALVLFGECVADQDPDGVMKLLKTSVESQAEIAAFRPLQKPMSICSQVTFKVDRFQMRGYLAEGAYRVALKSISSAS
jgi:hypothetical protein